MAFGVSPSADHPQNGDLDIAAFLAQPADEFRFDIHERLHNSRANARAAAAVIDGSSCTMAIAVSIRRSRGPGFCVTTVPYDFLAVDFLSAARFFTLASSLASKSETSSVASNSAGCSSVVKASPPSSFASTSSFSCSW
jgi:hypothetical protein